MSSRQLSPLQRQERLDNTIIASKNGLYYTKWSLLAVFSYLLIGDFCLQLMESVMPSIMPLQLDAAGASNMIKSTVLGTTSAVCNLTLNPYISYKSDGMRTKWGRRRPILLCMTPCVCLALILIAYAPEISEKLEGLGVGTILTGGILPKDPSTALTVATLALVTIIFQIFNYLMSPVFYYLFVDVVPDAYLGRFVACFRIVLTLAVYIFNVLIFPHAMTHTREIYIGAALLYGAGFFFMTLMTKEGIYPPPVHSKDTPIREKVRTYFRECYSHKHYLLFNARNIFFSLSLIFDIFFVFYLTKSLFISLEDIGQVTAYTALALLVLIYPSGALADKYKPVRVSFALMVACLPWGLISFLFITDHLSYMLIGSATLLFKGMVSGMDLPFYASIPPQDRYGQFGSANQLAMSIFLIPGTLLGGLLMDLVTHSGTQPEMYRYAYLYSFILFAISTMFMFFLYRSWWKHGGPDHYLPPAS